MWQLHRDEHGVGAGHASGRDFRGQPARDRAQIDGASLDQVIQNRSHGRLLALRSRRSNADHQGDGTGRRERPVTGRRADHVERVGQVLVIAADERDQLRPRLRRDLRYGSGADQQMATSVNSSPVVAGSEQVHKGRGRLGQGQLSGDGYLGEADARQIRSRKIGDQMGNHGGGLARTEPGR